MNWKNKLWQAADIIVDRLPHKSANQLYEEGHLVDKKTLSNGKADYELNYRGHRVVKELQRRFG